MHFSCLWAPESLNLCFSAPTKTKNVDREAARGTPTVTGLAAANSRSLGLGREAVVSVKRALLPGQFCIFSCLSPFALKLCCSYTKSSLSTNDCRRRTYSGGSSIGISSSAMTGRSHGALRSLRRSASEPAMTVFRLGTRISSASIGRTTLFHSLQPKRPTRGMRPAVALVRSHAAGFYSLKKLRCRASSGSCRLFSVLSCSRSLPISNS
jgi:hypothetical protein